MSIDNLMNEETTLEQMKAEIIEDVKQDGVESTVVDIIITQIGIETFCKNLNAMMNAIIDIMVEQNVTTPEVFKQKMNLEVKAIQEEMEKAFLENEKESHNPSTSK